MYVLLDLHANELIPPLLVRGLQMNENRSSPVPPPDLKLVSTDLKECGWDWLSYLGLGSFILLVLAMIIGIITCVCCCMRTRLSNI